MKIALFIFHLFLHEESINLAKNDLDGPIPSELFNITSLSKSFHFKYDLG